MGRPPRRWPNFGMFENRGLPAWVASVLSNGCFATLRTCSIQADGGSGLTLILLSLSIGNGAMYLPLNFTRLTVQKL